MSGLFADVKVGDVVELSNGQYKTVTSVSKARFKCGKLAFWKYRGMQYPYNSYPSVWALNYTTLPPEELKGDTNV